MHPDRVIGAVGNGLRSCIVRSRPHNPTAQPARYTLCILRVFCMETVNVSHRLCTLGCTIYDSFSARCTLCILPIREGRRGLAGLGNHGTETLRNRRIKRDRDLAKSENHGIEALRNRGILQRGNHTGLGDSAELGNSAGSEQPYRTGNGTGPGDSAGSGDSAGPETTVQDRKRHRTGQ